MVTWSYVARIPHRRRAPPFRGQPGSTADRRVCVPFSWAPKGVRPRGAKCSQTLLSTCTSPSFCPPQTPLGTDNHTYSTSSQPDHSSTPGATCAQACKPDTWAWSACEKNSSSKKQRSLLGLFPRHSAVGPKTLFTQRCHSCSADHLSFPSIPGTCAPGKWGRWQDSWASERMCQAVLLSGP